MNRNYAIEQAALLAVDEAFYLGNDSHLIHELRDALAMPKDAERVKLLERIDYWLTGKDFEYESDTQLMSDIRAYLQGGDA
jgi:hypothetical protein